MHNYSNIIEPLQANGVLPLIISGANQRDKAFTQMMKNSMSETFGISRASSMKILAGMYTTKNLVEIYLYSIGAMPAITALTYMEVAFAPQLSYERIDLVNFDSSFEFTMYISFELLNTMAKGAASNLKEIIESNYNEFMGIKDPTVERWMSDYAYNDPAFDLMSEFEEFDTKPNSFNFESQYTLPWKEPIHSSNPSPLGRNDSDYYDRGRMERDVNERTHEDNHRDNEHYEGMRIA